MNNIGLNLSWNPFSATDFDTFQVLCSYVSTYWIEVPLLALLSALSACHEIVCRHTHIGSIKIQQRLCLRAPAPPKAGIWSGISLLQEPASGGADWTGCAAANPSCSWLGYSRVGCLSKVIALEGASVHSSKLCSVVKHIRFLLSVYQHVYIIRCAAGFTPMSSTWLLDSAEVAIWLQLLLSLWPWSCALYASSELYITLRIIFRTSVCL